MTQSAGHSALPSSIQPGDLVGKYRIDEQIGSGGSAIVWRATDPLLNRIVAIKQLSATTLDMDSHTAKEHFANEAKLGRELSEKDPRHLVAIYEYISEERGLFIVMQYIEGSSLETILRKLAAPMPPKQALGIIAATAMGLQHLHDHGVVHRDLKPANILMPNNGGLKICDFGLASLIGDTDTMAAGSVRYMAPQLTSGEAVDGRADLYALGIIAYEMLAGRENFEQAFRFVLKDQRNQSLRWMKWHSNHRAKATPLHELVPGLDKTVSQLIDRLMAKDLSQRIASGSELVDTIKRHFTGTIDHPDTPQLHATTITGQTQKTSSNQPLSALPGSNEPTAMLPRKSRLPLYLGLFIIIQLLVLGGFLLTQNHKEEEAHKARITLAHNAYKQALDQFKAKDYPQASILFSQLIKQWPASSNLGLKSRGYQLLCEAHIHLKNKAYDAGVQAFIAADESGAFEPKQREQLKVLIRETQRQSAFANQIDKIQLLMGEAKYDLARQQLIEQNSYSPTPVEQKTLDDLSIKLNAMVGQSRIANILDKAQQLVDTGRQDEAIAMLEEKQLRFSNQLLGQKINELKRTREYEQALVDARTAQRNNQLSQAIESYSRAQQIKEDSAVAQQINQLRAQMAYQVGQERERAGDLQSATTQYTRALSFADMPQARTAIARINNANARATLVSAGDDAMSARNYSTAMEHYQNAIAMGSDTGLRQKLTTAQTQMHYQAGRRALKQSNLAVARKELNAAAAVAPNDSRIITAIAQLKTLSDYTLERDTGDKYRAKGEFGNAKTAYNRAKKIITNDEIRTRLNDTEYEHLVAQAKHHIGVRQFNQARISLRLAGKIHNTDEVRQLLIQVSKEE
ncbi:MAG: protein kinase [Phycisphaeraceae bacterium]|nr:protein kinase [Phycisphaeraceae bacterium]